MQPDYRDIIIEPRYPRTLQALPETALLVVNPQDAMTAEKMARRCGFISQMLHRTPITIEPERRFLITGPALGAPAAAILAEQLIAAGVSNILLFSCCGTLDPGNGVGAVVVPRVGVVGEGVSRWYGGEELCRIEPEARSIIECIVSDAGLPCSSGVVWTTDAPFRERRSELLLLRERYGVCCVDMEYSALCSVAALRRICFGAVFVVSDMLWTRNWKPGFGSAPFRNSTEGLLQELVVNRAVSRFTATFGVA